MKLQPHFLKCSEKNSKFDKSIIDLWGFLSLLNTFMLFLVDLKVRLDVNLEATMFIQDYLNRNLMWEDLEKRHFSFYILVLWTWLLLNQEWIREMHELTLRKIFYNWLCFTALRRAKLFFLCNPGWLISSQTVYHSNFLFPNEWLLNM